MSREQFFQSNYSPGETLKKWDKFIDYWLTKFAMFQQKVFWRKSLFGSSPVQSQLSPFQSSRVQFNSLQQSPIYNACRSNLSVQFHVIHSFLSCPVLHHKTSADSHYQYKDWKGWTRKGSMLHWVFSSLPFCCMWGGWEQTSQKILISSWLVRFFVGWKEDRVNKESASWASKFYLKLT